MIGPCTIPCDYPDGCACRAAQAAGYLADRDPGDEAEHDRHYRGRWDSLDAYAAKRHIKALEAALEWYADPANYERGLDWRGGIPFDLDSPVQVDDGARARAALGREP